MGADTEARRASTLGTRRRARCRSPKRRTTLRGRSQGALSALDALVLRGTRTSGFPKCLAAATRMCTPAKHTRQNERSVRWKPREGGLLGARGHADGCHVTTTTTPTNTFITRPRYRHLQPQGVPGRDTTPTSPPRHQVWSAASDAAESDRLSEAQGTSP